MNHALDKPLTLKDFTADQEVRWCPGCGDYAILKTVQKLMPELGRPRENQVFISGIGCSSRFPYYMNTYGFHTIHGRAASIATGVKLANPELDVWVVTGDGDALSIGGNHTIHALRRNIDLNILLFNNEIYGLTKGQYSPTSKVGTRSPSTPLGSVDKPLNPCSLALGAGASFVARSIDTEMKHLTAVIKAGYAHQGASFMEILQNCPIYNDGIFDSVKDKKTAAEHRLELVHGQAMIFGLKKDKGIRLNRQTLQLEVMPINSDTDPEDVLIHDTGNLVLAQLLCALAGPDFPIATGVIYQKPATSYEGDLIRQRRELEAAGEGRGKLQALLNSGHTWTVS